MKEVEDFIQNITGNRLNLFTACAINWKGAFAPQSAFDLIELGLVKCLQGGEKFPEKFLTLRSA